MWSIAGCFLTERQNISEIIVEKPMSELIEEASEQTESGRTGVDKCSDVARFHLVHRVTLRR